MAAAVNLGSCRQITWKPSSRGAPPSSDQPAAADRGAARAALARLGEAQIDEAVVGEIGVEDDVAEPALAAIIDRRHAGDVDGGSAPPPRPTA